MQSTTREFLCVCESRLKFNVCYFLLFQSIAFTTSPGLEQLNYGPNKIDS